LHTLLSDSVGSEDRTAKAADKVAAAPAVKRQAKVAAAAKPVNAVEAPIVKAPATRTRRPRKTAAK
jgi:hypothetical protein